jgi:Na+-translocating ferredoxin:NAD+ oxidoreductase RnfG subunit
MKKLFEKPLFHYTFVLTMIALACGFLVGITYEITHPIIVENQKQAQLAAYEKVMPGIVDMEELTPTEKVSTVTASIKAKDSNGNYLGYVYVVNGTNGYGSMTIVVSVDLNGNIKASEFTVMNQTLNQDVTRNNLARYNGVSIMTLEEPAGIVGGATVSYGTIRQMFSDVARVHAQVAEDVVIVDPYETWFGEGYQLEEAETLTGDFLLNVRVVKNSAEETIGSVYALRGTAVYHSGNSGAIEIHIALDNDGVILGYKFEVYEHTSGFRIDVETYLNNEVVGININDFDDVEGIETGASNSSNLVIRMLTELKSEVASA